MAPKNPEEAKNDTHKSKTGSKKVPKKWHIPVHQPMEVIPPPPGSNNLYETFFMKECTVRLFSVNEGYYLVLSLPCFFTFLMTA